MGSNETKVVIALAFIIGFILGYKAKEKRILWLKRKRDRLADKLRQAQLALELEAKKE